MSKIVLKIPVFYQKVQNLEQFESCDFSFHLVIDLVKTRCSTRWLITFCFVFIKLSQFSKTKKNINFKSIIGTF